MSVKEVLTSFINGVEKSTPNKSLYVKRNNNIILLYSYDDIIAEKVIGDNGNIINYYLYTRKLHNGEKPPNNIKSYFISRTTSNHLTKLYRYVEELNNEGNELILIPNEI
jgi:hypothetical protein